eukprot:SAG31_NODE_1078_length_10032_cov_4.602034_11_plen_932_part_00
MWRTAAIVLLAVSMPLAVPIRAVAAGVPQAEAAPDAATQPEHLPGGEEVLGRLRSLEEGEKTARLKEALQKTDDAKSGDLKTDDDRTRTMPGAYFVCTEPNDLVNLLRNLTGQHFDCMPSLKAAINAAPNRGVVLSLAAEWPARTDVTSESAVASLAIAVRKSLRLYIEFPNGLPATNDVDGGTAMPLNQTTLERVVVTNRSAVPLQAERILNMHAIKYTDFKSIDSQLDVDLAIATVAGFDDALFGIPLSAKPLLFRLGGRGRASPGMLISATQLSNLGRRRFAPVAAWQAVMFSIARFAGFDVVARPEQLEWKPICVPSYPKSAVLAPSAQHIAFERAVEWYIRSGMIPDANVTRLIASAVRHNSISGSMLLNGSLPHGSGRMGVLEGFTSSILDDGRQPHKVALRNDCICETAMAFAFRSALRRRGDAVAQQALDDTGVADASTATSLQSYAWIHSGFSQTWLPGDSLGATFGLLTWSSGDQHSSSSFFKDDQARSLLAGLSTAALLRTDRFNTQIATAMYGNLRLSCKGGFGPASSDVADIQRSGWRVVFDADMSADKDMYSPHYQSYMWAVFLWASRQSNFAPFYDRAFAAIQHMMTRFPSFWQPTMNGITMQRARMLLPLAWLVRTNNTALSHEWLITIADGLLARQDHTSGAFREEVSAEGWGNAAITPNNENYGTFEAPLNQENDDPVSDLLYTAPFAFLGLHEAAAATGNETLRAAEDRLADFLVRAQTRSDRAEFDGAFFRAFDFNKHEVWGSDADAGWGAWSVETGWSQSWITATFGLRLANTSLWELTQGSVDLRPDLAGWKDVFFFPAGPDSVSCVNSSTVVDTNLTVVMETSLGELCAPAPGKLVSRLRFSGSTCGEGRVVWNSMETIDPRAGLRKEACRWSAAAEGADWTARWLGSCGVPPTRMLDLPVHTCQVRR